MEMTNVVRDQFLASLVRENKDTIQILARNLVGKYATPDIIRGECTTQFMVGANRAITSYREGGKNLQAWCVGKGLNAVRDWLRVEFGLRARLPENFMPQKKLLRLEGVPDRFFPETVDYEEAVVSTLNVRSFLARLSALDRSIVELLVFGMDDFGPILCANQWNGIAKPGYVSHIAHTINRSESYVFSRIAAIRKEAPALGVAV